MGEVRSISRAAPDRDEVVGARRGGVEERPPGDRALALLELGLENGKVHGRKFFHFHIYLDLKKDRRLVAMTKFFIFLHIPFRCAKLTRKT